MNPSPTLVIKETCRGCGEKMDWPVKSEDQKSQRQAIKNKEIICANCEAEAAHQARVREVIAAVRLAESTDPNIGREWNSRYGRQRIRRRVANGGTLDVTSPRYEVDTLGTHAIHIYSVDSIEATIQRDEYELSPEYAQELADLEALTLLHQQRKAQREAEESAELAEIAKFTHGLRPMTAGKIRNALLKLHIFDGVTMSLREAIVQLVAAGKSPEIRIEWAIQEMTRRQFNRADGDQQRAHERRRQAKGKIPFYYVGGYRLGKTAYDYAFFLQQSEIKNPQSSIVNPPTRRRLTPERIAQLATAFAS